MVKKFEEVGKGMKKGKKSGRDWRIVEDTFKQHRWVFGNKKFCLQGIGTPKDKQAAKFHPEFGRGYNEETPKNEQKSKNKRTRNNDCINQGN